MEIGIDIVLLQVFSFIKWQWYALAVIVSFIIGALWYSVFFAKAWIRVFKVEVPEKVSTGRMIGSMLLQLIANMLLGLALFIVVKLSVIIAFIVLLSFCGWQKAGLNFQFPRWKDFLMAVTIQVGGTFLVGLTYILLGLL